MELGAQGLNAALLDQQLPHVPAKIRVGFRFRGTGMMQDLPEDPEQRFLDLTLVGLHLTETVNSSVSSSPHPADEHLDELITRLGLGLMQEAQQQGVPPPWLADIAQVAGLQGLCLGRELSDLGVGDLTEERPGIKEGIKLGEPVDPQAQVLQGWRSWRLL